MSSSIDFTPYLVPILVVIAAGLLGFIFERIVILRLKKLAVKTSWEIDDILLGSLKGMIPLWFIIGVIHVQTLGLEFQPQAQKLIEQALLVLFIFSVTLVLTRIAVGAITLYGKKDNGALPSTSIFANITKIVVFLVGFLVILDSLGISVTPIITALGVGGLAVALALQDTLGNLFSGLHILASRQVQPGNYVKLESCEEGYVVDIGWRTTTIRQLPNNLIIIPNSKLAAAIITNYYLPEKEMAVVVPVGVSYNSDLEHVETVTKEVAREIMEEIQGGIPEFSPFIRYNTFADSSINFSVILRANEFVDQYLIKHEFIKRLHKRYRDQGIEIPFPQRDLHIKSKVD